MTLAELIRDIDVTAVHGPPGTRVSGLQIDSRRIVEGDVFVALSGSRVDGNRYVGEAIRRGAAAVVSEKPPQGTPTVTWVETPDARRAAGLLSAGIHDHPSRRLKVVGITGTNGKTTTAFLLEGVLRALAPPTAMTGTVVRRVADEEVPAQLTTPEAPEVHSFLAKAVQTGCRFAVMEVSSHALALGRFEGVEVACSLFTNLTRDHLDFHGDMESYFQAKRRLFDHHLRPDGHAIIGIDDPYGRRLVEGLAGPVTTFGFHEGASLRITSIAASFTGLELSFTEEGSLHRLRSPLLGRHNAPNLLAAYGAARAFGFAAPSVLEVLSILPGAPGRFEKVDVGQPFHVVVDYAHTDDAIRNVLETARELPHRRTLVVVGCGGDRDRSKRPLMGAVAARLSELLILTSDNPRSEDPRAIISDIEQGARSPGSRAEIRIEPDREKAIALGLSLAGPSDLVMILGKGHEPYQLVGNQVLPFDDRAVARAILRRGGFSAAALPRAGVMLPPTLEEAARWMEGDFRAGASLRPGGFSIDSRTLQPGDLFFAIVGRNADGHRFVPAAVQRGAIGVVLSEPLSLSPEVACIRVSDTTLALQRLAQAVRARAHVRVVAVTGSMGKTTTKDAIAAALSKRFLVLKSPGNLNNLYGLPLSLLRLREETIAVLEMGMSAPGEIARLTEIARPDAGVLTNVAEVHREFFPSLDAIASAKGELLRGLSEEALAVVNADDPLVLREARRFRGRRLTYGCGSGAEVRAENVERRDDELRFDVIYGGARAPVRSRLLGLHNVYNLLAAFAVASAFGLDLAEASNALAALRPASHRGERLRFARGIVVIDETYNSNPRALGAALSSLAEEPAARRVAVLGDMLELGDDAPEWHRQAGASAAAFGVGLLIGVGELGRLIAEGAGEAGMPAAQLLAVETAEEAGELLHGRLRPGDVVLIKASRGIALERAVALLSQRLEREGA